MQLSKKTYYLSCERSWRRKEQARRDSAIDILAHDAPDTALLEERKIV